MSEELKTIKEIADELGVSKQAVWQKIKRTTSIDLRKFTSTKGNTVYVDGRGQKAIKKMFNDKNTTKRRQHRESVDVNENMYVDDSESTKEIDFLRNLVLEIQSEKKELHKLLDQQQRLALQDKKLLDEYKAENAHLKSLEIHSQDTQSDEAGNQNEPNKELDTLKSDIRSLQEQLKEQAEIVQHEVARKWWQLWK